MFIWIYLKLWYLNVTNLVFGGLPYSHLQEQCIKLGSTLVKRTSWSKQMEIYWNLVWDHNGQTKLRNWCLDVSCVKYVPKPAHRTNKQYWEANAGNLFKFFEWYKGEPERFFKTCCIKIYETIYMNLEFSCNWKSRGSLLFSILPSSAQNPAKPVPDYTLGTGGTCPRAQHNKRHNKVSNGIILVAEHTFGLKIMPSPISLIDVLFLI